MKILKTCLIILLFNFLLVTSANAREIKFVQVTDSHFATEYNNATQREVEGSVGFLKNAVKDINSIPELDFVIFTGDNIDQPNSDELKKFLKVANQLKVPYYMVIGNHEVFKSQNFTKKEYLQTVRRYSKSFSYKPSCPNYVFSKKGIVFIVVDGAKEVIPGPAGYFKKDTLKWLDKKLYKYRNDKVIIVQHFPLVPPYYNRTHTTYNAQDYKDMLKKHSNVIAIISGHYHANGEQMVDGVYHISSPALVEPPHNYKIIEIDIKSKKDYKIYTQLRHAE